MGLFDRFRGDPLARAERALGRGDARGALSALAKASGQRADDLRNQARSALTASLIAKADGAEAEGYKGDAADWLRIVLEEMPEDAPERAALAQRVKDLDQAVGVAAAAEAAATHSRALAVDMPSGESASMLDVHPDDLFENLVEVFRDDVADAYRAAPEAFRHAWVRLNHGNATEALAIFDDLASDAAVVALERGRALLASGDPAGACQALDQAWEGLGADVLDHAGAQSVPQLWAEAQLELGEGSVVVDRLEPLFAHDARNDLAKPYGLGLLASGRADDAVAFLRQTLDQGADPRALVPLLADALDAKGEPERAVAELEGLIAPSCAGGGCQRPPLHMVAVRSVVSRYLARGGDADLERAREHLERLIATRGGTLELEDCRCLAAFYHAAGEPERAAEVEALLSREILT